MPLTLLSEGRFLRQQATKPVEGRDAATLIAQLDIPEEPSPLIAYLKIYPRTHTKGLLNESIGYLLAESLGLAVPKYAGMIALNQSAVLSALGWKPGMEPVAWFSTDTGHPSLAAAVKYHPTLPPGVLMLLAQRLEKLLKKHAKSTQRIIAFDEITANSDRNPGNILLNAGGFELIDHGRILTSYDWKTPELLMRIGADVPNLLFQMAGAETGKLPYKQGVIFEYDNLAASLGSVLPEIRKELIVVFDEADVDCALEFIEMRPSAINMPNKVGMIL